MKYIVQAVAYDDDLVDYTIGAPVEVIGDNSNLVEAVREFGNKGHSHLQVTSPQMSFRQLWMLCNGQWWTADVRPRP